MHEPTGASESQPKARYHDASGNLLIAWEGDDGNNRGIYRRWFDKNGFSLTDPKLVNLNLSGAQQFPVVAALDNGDMIIAWRDGDGHIYGRKFDEDDTPLEAVEETVLPEGLVGDQAPGEAVSLQDSTFAVTWETTAADGNIDVKARVWDAATGEATGEIDVNTTTAAWQLNPSIDADAEGNFVVAWDSFAQDDDVEGVFYRRFAKDGQALSEELQANATTDNEQQRPTVAMDPGGGFLIAWESFGQPGGDSYDIIARCYTPDGTAVVPESAVNTETTAAQQHADAAWAPAPARYVVTWQSHGQDGDTWGVYGQVLGTTCQKLGSPFQVNQTSGNEQSRPAVATDAQGRAVIAWRSLNQDGDTWGVYARRYLADGSPETDEFRVNDVTAGEQRQPAVSFLTDNHFIVGWTTSGEDESGLATKFQRYDADGVKSGLAFFGNVFTPGDQERTQIVPLDGGGYSIYWRSEDQDGDGDAVFGRFFPEE